MADKARVQRLVARAAARDQRDLAADRGVRAGDQVGSCATLTRSAWAAPKPSRLSLRTFSTALISFFMAGTSRFSTPDQQRDDAARGVPHGLLELALQAGVAEVRHADLDHVRVVRPGTFLDRLAAARMGDAIGSKEARALLGREMADLEDRRQVARRHRRRTGRVDDLRDEALLLAERLRDLLARARRPAVEAALQQDLVGAHR